MQKFTDCILFPLQYLACLSTSSSNDKLAFDVGLQEHSQGLYLAVYILRVSTPITPICNNLEEEWANITAILKQAAQESLAESRRWTRKVKPSWSF